MSRTTLGRHGEALAKTCLEAKGYLVVHRNWRYSRLGEIDLIAYHPDKQQLAFVEVKTRKSTEFGSAIEAVSEIKQQTIRQLAEIYLAQHPPKSPVQVISFDVITVSPNPLNQSLLATHIENAF